MRWKRAAVVGVAALAGAGGLWWAFAPQPVAVDMAAVSRGDLVVTIADEGLAQVRKVYTVATPVAGEVLRIDAEPGDEVQEGQVLATIVPAESGLLDIRTRAETEAVARAAEDAVLSAQAELTMAQSELEHWQADLDRKHRLLERGITTLQAVQQSQLEVSRREAMIANATASLEMRQHQLEQARARLDDSGSTAIAGSRRDVLAPVTGRVLRVLNTGAATLPAGTPLLELGDPQELEIVADLLSADTVRLSIGAPATITGWGGAQELKAKVARIEPTGFTKVSALGVEEQRVPVHLDLLDAPEQRASLAHLFRVFVEIEVHRIAPATLVPISALFRSREQWSVFVVEDGRASLRNIQLGARNSEMAQVVEGVEPGTMVVLYPSDQVIDGVEVEPR